ncbi:MAG TPA: sensor histidine kinase [Gemmatimonadaceae bacterium]|nr:sensor histidine kinase [Gemmatimonadaceae bacterium]
MSEFHAAILQAAVTAGVAVVCWYLYASRRQTAFLWWSVAWSLYVLRIGAIIAFLATNQQPWWLFAHQVLTGSTALALLWAALSMQGVRWRPMYAAALLFPLVWSYVAIYHLRSFLLAAIPAVLFLSFATLWTSGVFFGLWRRTRSRGALVVAVVLLVWGVHHLDYPVLRAQGAWNPWGYYLDILFVLAVTMGIVLLGLDELDRRTHDLERLSARMVDQHEEERRRVSRELHDQTAQVWAAVKLQLGLIREQAPADLAPSVSRVLDLVDTGITSIRGVTTTLRPPLLDDLGLVPALRALVQSFAEQSALMIEFDAPPAMPNVSPQAALALFRALQEALSNVVRHSQATNVFVRLAHVGGEVTLEVRDNGVGFPQQSKSSSESSASSVVQMGLAGMRERISALHGSVSTDSHQGARITVTIPVENGRR